MLSKGSTEYTINELNELTSVNSTYDYSYGLNGNMVSREDGDDDWSYSYDPVNRLIKVERSGDVQRLYGYDADGRRVRSCGGASGNTR